MGAANFAYTNRCIVVKNDDYEWGNMPEIDETCRTYYDRSYNGQRLAVSDKFKWHDVVINAGYYEDACIDYVRREDAYIEDYLGQPYYYNTRKEFFNECRYQFGVSERFLRRVCGRVADFGCFDAWLDNAYEKLADALAEREEDEVNAELDQIKAGYGYEEYGCFARFSNGEAMYKKIG